MTNDVTISYSDYGNSSVIEEAYFELIEDIKVTLAFDEANKQVSMRMEDTISDNTELEGVLTYDKINVFIRVLSHARAGGNPQQQRGRQRHFGSASASQAP